MALLGEALHGLIAQFVGLSLRRPIVHPIVLAKKGVMGGVLCMVKWGFKIAFFHQAGLYRAQTSRVSHLWPHYYAS